MSNEQSTMTLQEAVEMARQTHERLVAEETYIFMNGSVPAWAVFIDYYETVDDSYIFIHRDPSATS